MKNKKSLKIKKNNMDKVKIKRVKRVHKKTSGKEKVLAALGAGSSLLGGAGVVTSKPSATQFVRTQQAETSNNSSKIKKVLSNVFGIGKAKAFDGSLQESGTTVNDSSSLELQIPLEQDSETQAPVSPPEESPSQTEEDTKTEAEEDQQLENNPLPLAPDPTEGNNNGEESKEQEGGQEEQKQEVGKKEKPGKDPELEKNLPPILGQYEAPPIIAQGGPAKGGGLWLEGIEDLEKSGLPLKMASVNGGGNPGNPPQTPNISTTITGEATVPGLGRVAVQNGRVYNAQGQDITDTLTSTQIQAINGATFTTPAQPIVGLTNGTRTLSGIGTVAIRDGRVYNSSGVEITGSLTTAQIAALTSTPPPPPSSTTISATISGEATISGLGRVAVVNGRAYNAQGQDITNTLTPDQIRTINGTNFVLPVNPIAGLTNGNTYILGFGEVAIKDGRVYNSAGVDITGQLNIQQIEQAKVALRIPNQNGRAILDGVGEIVVHNGRVFNAQGVDITAQIYTNPDLLLKLSALTLSSSTTPLSAPKVYGELSTVPAGLTRNIQGLGNVQVLNGAVYGADGKPINNLTAEQLAAIRTAFSSNTALQGGIDVGAPRDVYRDVAGNSSAYFGTLGGTAFLDKATGKVYVTVNGQTREVTDPGQKAGVTAALSRTSATDKTVGYDLIAGLTAPAGGTFNPNFISVTHRMPDGKDYNFGQTVDFATAQKLAELLGGGAKVIIADSPGLSAPVYQIIFPGSGYVGDARDIAAMLQNNSIDYVKNSVMLEVNRSGGQTNRYVDRVATGNNAQDLQVQNSELTRTPGGGSPGGGSNPGNSGAGQGGDTSNSGTIVTQNLPDATVGTRYEQTLPISGILTLNSGTFPNGMFWDGGSNKLIGIPSQTGTYSFVLQNTTTNTLVRFTFVVKAGAGGPSGAGGASVTLTADQERIAALTRQISDLQATLNQLRQQSNTGVSPELVNFLNQRINDLQNQLRGNAQTFGRVGGASTPFVGLRMPENFESSEESQNQRNNTSTANTQTYKVKKGDTLSGIAKKVYGDSSKWRKILSANPNSLSKSGDVKTLKIGFNLVIPR
jgi:hypothetical protein